MPQTVLKLDSVHDLWVKHCGHSAANLVAPFQIQTWINRIVMLASMERKYISNHQTNTQLLRSGYGAKMCEKHFWNRLDSEMALRYLKQWYIVVKIKMMHKWHETYFALLSAKARRRTLQFRSCTPESWRYRTSRAQKSPSMETWGTGKFETSEIPFCFLENYFKSPLSVW